MKKIFTLFLILFSLITLTYAARVDVNTAKNTGRQFMVNNAAAGQLKNISDLNLSYTSYVLNSMIDPGPGAGGKFLCFQYKLDSGVCNCFR